jgi:hypothetical protein
LTIATALSLFLHGKRQTPAAQKLIDLLGLNRPRSVIVGLWAGNVRPPEEVSPTRCAGSPVLALPRPVAIIDPCNQGSIRVAQKCGLRAVREGCDLPRELA